AARAAPADTHRRPRSGPSGASTTRGGRYHRGGAARTTARGAALYRADRRTTDTDQAAGRVRRGDAGGGGDQRDRRDRRGWQDRSSAALGAPGRRTLPGRTVVREPARP